jgi:GNAT superfamily N-acetyltransferase
VTRLPDAGEIESDPCLDNVVWISLSGPHQDLAERNGRAIRYRAEYSPLGAVSHYTAENVAAVAGMLRPTERLDLLTLDAPPIPTGYRIVEQATIVQMIGAREYASPDDEKSIVLDKADVPDMLNLARLTHLEPFRERATEMGTFIGFREGAALVAMAGERMIAGRYVELGTLGTHPDWQRRGLARQLVEHLSALQLYQRLEFRRARHLLLTGLVIDPDLR